MKKLYILILFLLIANVSCQAPRDVNFYYVKIKPIGMSDAPRVLIYISTIKLNKIINIDTDENVGFNDQVVTDEKTLRNIVLFIGKDDSSKNIPQEHFNDFGCINISMYEKKSVITSYNLDTSQNRKYLNSLIDMLVENKLDVKVIKILKEEVLAEIQY
jgi:hypothetical protein